MKYMRQAAVVNRSHNSLVSPAAKGALLKFMAFQKAKEPRDEVSYLSICLFLMPRQAPAVYDIYAEQLRILRKGHPLYYPEPHHELGPVRIADVGYIQEGAFHRLFNAMCTARAQDFKVPNGFVPLTNSGTYTKISRDMEKDSYQSTTVTTMDVDVMAPGAIGGFRYICNSSRGAVLRLETPSERVVVDSLLHFKRYTKENCISWYDYAHEHGHDVSFGDILFVTGLSTTSAWSSVVFTARSAVEIRFRLGEEFQAAGDVRVNFGVRKTSPVFCRMSEGYRQLTSLALQNLPKNQTVFVEGYRPGPRRLYFSSISRKIMRMILGSEDDGEGSDSTGMESQTSTPSTRSSSSSTRSSPSTHRISDFQPAVALLAYRMEVLARRKRKQPHHKETDNSEVVVVHDDDWCKPKNGKIIQTIDEYARYFFGEPHSSEAGSEKNNCISAGDDPVVVERDDSQSMYSTEPRHIDVKPILQPDQHGAKDGVVSGSLKDGPDAGVMETGEGKSGEMTHKLRHALEDTEAQLRQDCEVRENSALRRCEASTQTMEMQKMNEEVCDSEHVQSNVEAEKRLWQRQLFQERCRVEANKTEMDSQLSELKRVLEDRSTEVLLWKGRWEEQEQRLVQRQEEFEAQLKRERQLYEEQLDRALAGKAELKRQNDDLAYELHKMGMGKEETDCRWWQSKSKSDAAGICKEISSKENEESLVLERLEERPLTEEIIRRSKFEVQVRKENLALSDLFTEEWPEAAVEIAKLDGKFEELARSLQRRHQGELDQDKVQLDTHQLQCSAKEPQCSLANRNSHIMMVEAQLKQEREAYDARLEKELIRRAELERKCEEFSCNLRQTEIEKEEANCKIEKLTLEIVCATEEKAESEHLWNEQSEQMRQQIWEERQRRAALDAEREYRDEEVAQQRQNRNIENMRLWNMVDDANEEVNAVWKELIRERTKHTTAMKKWNSERRQWQQDLNILPQKQQSQRRIVGRASRRSFRRPI